MPLALMRLNRSYVDRGFLIRDQPAGDSPHRQGGAARHAGAECLLTGQPLTLIWDIALESLELAQLPGKLFTSFKRLPLYFGFHSGATLSYQLLAEDRIKVIETPDPDPAEGAAYDDFPVQFEEREISLLPVPTALNNLLLLMQEIDDEDWLVDSDKQMLSRWLEREVEDRPDLWRHQFGGACYLLGGHEELLCPNLSCELSRPWVRDEIRFTMKELAVIHNDPARGLPLADPVSKVTQDRDIDHWVQLVYHLCEECLTLRVSWRRG
jgi:hypothetical protein